MYTNTMLKKPFCVKKVWNLSEKGVYLHHNCLGILQTIMILGWLRPAANLFYVKKFGESQKISYFCKCYSTKINIINVFLKKIAY